MLDTSAFICGFDPSYINEEAYTVPEVEAELLENSLPKLRFYMAVESGKLRIIEPSHQYLNIVREVSGEVGDIGLLSKADMAILALALQLKEAGQNPTIITEDYSIQNVAEKLGIKHMPLASLGIRYQLHWTLYCPACGKRYPSNQKITTCERCGTELKRKPLKKTLIKRE
ncbi:MAG: NOB1 family endonuclease [Candidatus Bathyarchaeia archaeon]|nr:NOB1 family endonuclease [Candidatus Bathyarchaeota archaeon]